MLSRLFEWYQLVNPAPASEVIGQRRASVSKLVETILKKDDHDLLVQSVSAAVFGLDRIFTNESPLVAVVVETIRAEQPAFPEDLAENALELRVCCALAVGEILSRSRTAPDPGDSVLAATMLRSALGVRPEPRERFLKRIFEELQVASNAVLLAAARRKRERDPQALDTIEKCSELPALEKFLKGYLGELQRQTMADQEELNILWWMFTGHSSTVAKRIGDLKPLVAALCCGAELANLAVLPPTSSTIQMVERAVKTGRKSSDLRRKQIQEIARDWDQHLVSILVPTNESAQKLIEDYPCLMPISWLCRRLADSQFTADWKSEFERRTGIPADHSISPLELAAQAFNERIAQRIYAE